MSSGSAARTKCCSRSCPRLSLVLDLSEHGDRCQTQLNAGPADKKWQMQIVFSLTDSSVPSELEARWGTAFSGWSVLWVMGMPRAGWWVCIRGCALKPQSSLAETGGSSNAFLTGPRGSPIPLLSPPETTTPPWCLTCPSIRHPGWQALPSTTPAEGPPQSPPPRKLPAFLGKDMDMLQAGKVPAPSRTPAVTRPGSEETAQIFDLGHAVSTHSQCQTWAAPRDVTQFSTHSSDLPATPICHFCTAAASSSCLKAGLQPHSYFSRNYYRQNIETVHNRVLVWAAEVPHTGCFHNDHIKNNLLLYFPVSLFFSCSLQSRSTLCA